VSFFTADNIRSVTGGRWLERSAKEPKLTGVGTDTREDLREKIFVAIKGETHDGHAFLEQAVKAGAALLIVEQEIDRANIPPGIGTLHVDNTRRALAKLALGYRRTLRGTRVIAVTGSAGKTTTKRLIDGVLSTTLQGTSSPKSFNNDIGVPLTILQARLSDKYLIVEIGTNNPGEIAQLAAMTEPDIVVITSIGRSHLQGFGSIDAVAKEKTAILQHLQPSGLAILNADTSLLRPHLKLVKSRVLFGESEDADLRLTGRGGDADGKHWWLEVNNRQRFNIALPGKHNAINALAAIAVGRRMGLDDEQIGRGLAAVVPAGMRLTPQQIGGITVYNDAYNANPESMIAALDTFAELTSLHSGRRRIVILGDMLELGDAGPELHREIGRHVLTVDLQTRIDHAVFIGERSAFAAAEVARQWPSERVTALSAVDAESMRVLAGLLKPGDIVLIKASRGMGLERLLTAIEQAATRSTATVEVPPATRAVNRPISNI
jgi:UDP-N-acetylmuramoyl-tripeptide--D-alanyl-D-alanine ligase